MSPAMIIDETHDPALLSWIPSANEPGCDFPVQNLPLGIFRESGRARVGVAIGDSIVDAAACTSGELATACEVSRLNELMSLGRDAWRRLRLDVSRALRIGGSVPGRAVHLRKDCDLLLPADIGDYSDFYSSIHHATRAGAMFRPDNPLLPNYKWVPIAYHGRASSIVVSGTRIVRPSGQVAHEGRPEYQPSRQLDYELELGFFVGPGNAVGQPVPIHMAQDHVFGFCMVNDWSARDIQSWEYQPLGPFLAKSFATTVSPWVITAEALAPFRTSSYERAPGDPQPLSYLSSEEDSRLGGFDITVEAWLRTQRMSEPVRLSRGNFRDVYWTVAQMLTHHASNGCNLRSGDLLASGTISNESPDSGGCLLELTKRGTEPVQLPSGETRGFLRDGDEVILRAFSERDGFRRIGFGECSGIVVSPSSAPRPS